MMKEALSFRNAFGLALVLTHFTAVEGRAQVASATTLPATVILVNFARLQGNAQGGFNTTWFEYGSSQSQVAAGTGTKIGFMNAGGFRQFDLNGLTGGTTYYFRFVGNGAAGAVLQGTVLQFKTLAALPTMTTAAASNVTQNSATMNGTFADSPTSTWFRYGTGYNQVGGHGTPDVSLKSTAVVQASAAGSLTANLTGLTAGESYFFQAAGATAGGNGYGTVKNFTMMPEVNTTPASGVSKTTATLNGSFSSKTLYTSFIYGKSATLGTLGALLGGTQVGAVNQSATSGALSYSLTGLQAGITYYFQAVSQNFGGTVYGPTLSFTTTP
ncbi:MAG: hypothetical protein NTU67_00330 [Gemmatimonadetes bacterium]|nr:hypothetical protein [Gemmatimonadota bacterium]